MTRSSKATPAPLPTAQEGDLIKTSDLQACVPQLLALAAGLEELLVENCTFPERRRILRRKRSLIALAAFLAAGDIALQPGEPRISAAQIGAAVDYAASVIGATSALNETLSCTDALLDLFVAVVGGSGAHMLAAALRLKHPPPASTRSTAFRPWEAVPYVLIPMRGMRAPEMALLSTVPQIAVASSAQVAQIAQIAQVAQVAQVALAAPLRPSQLLHSMHADGAKLVELTEADVRNLKVAEPGVRVLPLVLYQVCRRPLLELRHDLVGLSAKLAVTLKVRVVQAGAAQSTQTGVAGAHVIAFTDFTQRIGADGISDANGDVALALGAGSQQIDVLVIYGPHGYWGLYRRQFTLEQGAQLELPALDLAALDYLALQYGALPPTAGQGVTVGVIDTGIDLKHPDLQVAGGAAFVVDEDDAGGPGPAATEGEHGSHVAGIIASRGAPPSGKRGVAPAVRLMSYRVFPNAGGGASNYDIIRAIDRGVADGCDLLNLSLGGAAPDEAVHEAIKTAFDHGTVCIVAAGNDNRSPVSYPAHWPESVAVSALGKRGTYPAHSTEEVDDVAPFAPGDPSIFVAGFSNIGPELDLAGPGVGIVSTVPGGHYAVMSGTSMACPAVAGATAALLGKSADVLAMPRDRQRAIAILGLINGAARSLGLAQEYQGLGMLDAGGGRRQWVKLGACHA